MDFIFILFLFSIKNIYIYLIIRTKYISYYAIVDMRANNRTELESKQKAAHNLFSLI